MHGNSITSMTTEPKVTVVVPSYNHEKFVEEAISSILNQTFQDFEIIITDDGSTDNSVARINKFKDPRIYFFPFPKNLGACTVVNFALQKAKGKFIALLNSDDIFLPEKLEKQVNFLEHNENISAIFSDAQLIDENGTTIPDSSHYYGTIFKQPNRTRFAWLNHFFFKENCLCHPTILIRSDCYRTLGGYNESYAQLPDFEFWIRFCLRYDLHISSEKLISFRILNNNANASGRRPDVLSRSDWEHRQLLDWFLEIPPEDFVKVFFDYSGPTPQNRRDVAFALAQMALTSNVHHGFAIDVLYRLLRAEGSTHTFNHRDFIELTGKYGNVFIPRLIELEAKEKQLSMVVQQQQDALIKQQQQLAEQQRQLETQNDHLIRKDEQIDAIFRSTSWRVTRPLRQLSNRLKRSTLFHKKTKSSSVIHNAPFITIILSLESDENEHLQTFKSLVRQTYNRWKLVVSGNNLSSEQADSIKNLTGSDVRIETISTLSGSQLLNALEGDFVLRLKAGDILQDNAIELLLRELSGKSEAKIIYCDEKIINKNGNYIDFHLKPEWNQDLFYSAPYIERGVLINTELVRMVEGFDPEYGDAMDYDLLLKCVERVQPSQIRHLAMPLLYRKGEAQTLPSGTDYERAVSASLARRGIHAGIMPGGAPGVLRIRYPVPEPAPLVSIIILTRDRHDLLHRCVDSILEKTDYPAYEIIIVDNGSRESRTLEYMQALAQSGSARVIRDERPFNFPALNNIAIRQASGQFIAMLNNDMEVIDAHWLKEMVSHASRPGVGAVGARLWYPDNTLQHGGVIFVKGSALHAHRGLARGQAGYWGRAVAVQNFSAVTAACLVMRKELYLKVGGMNEVDLPVSYNDIDLCLKLGAAGYRTVWTPYAELYHYESASRGDDMSPENRKRAVAEYQYMVNRWGALMEKDPAWNAGTNTSQPGVLGSTQQKG